MFYCEYGPEMTPCRTLFGSTQYSWLPKKVMNILNKIKITITLYQEKEIQHTLTPTVNLKYL